MEIDTLLEELRIGLCGQSQSQNQIGDELLEQQHKIESLESSIMELLEMVRQNIRQ